MPSWKGIPADLSDTSVGRTARELLEIYRAFDGETEAFAAACAVRCPAGCGRCCKRFTPPVTRIEADLVALFLLDAAGESRVPDGSDAGQCPFYDAPSPLHCAIYTVRPLLCRGFGFCSFGGKDGNPRFSYCRHIPAPEPRHLDAAAMKRAFARMPPRMDDFYALVHALAHGTEGELPLLSEAMEESIGKVRAILSYARGERSGSGRAD